MVYLQYPAVAIRQTCDFAAAPCAAPERVHPSRREELPDGVPLEATPADGQEQLETVELDPELSEVDRDTF